MGNRNYNVFFNLHTVSGIIISIGLYVIFFAGAFTLFFESIHEWEEGKPHTANEQQIAISSFDYDRLLDSLKAKGFDLYGRSLYVHPEAGEKQDFYLRGSTDSLATEDAKKEAELSFNKATYEIYGLGGEAVHRYSFGSLLYSLHFFYQLGDFGYYLSGIVALFFLFAIVSGIVIHWDKIVTNFWVFRPKAKLKTVWTDAHTALGTIGLPFQLLYALTGAMFGLGVLLGLSGSLLYGGSLDKLYETVYGEHDGKLGKRTDMTAYPLNRFADSAMTHWPGFSPDAVQISNIGSDNMQFGSYGSVKTNAGFFNTGEVVYKVTTGKVVHQHDPSEVTYDEKVGVLYRLHFANFGISNFLGNYLLKSLYFIMAILTCFVILSGILIWLEARNRKSISDKEHRFNQRVGYIYLAICLSMLPITALTLIIAKLIPERWATESFFNWVFFGSWLVLSVAFRIKKDNYFTNRYALLSTGILGLFIPLVNGVVSGNWMWHTLANHQYEIFFMDAIWVFLAIVCLYSVYRMKRPELPAWKSSSSGTKPGTGNLTPAN